MALDWGMSPRPVLFPFGDQRGQVFQGEDIVVRSQYNEATARNVDEEVKRFLGEAYERAIEILKEHADNLARVAAALMEKEEITGEQVHMNPVRKCAYRHGVCAAVSCGRSFRSSRGG